MYKSFIYKFIWVLICSSLIACGSTPQKPYGFTAGTTTFNLLPTTFQLNHGMGAPQDLTIFASQDEMRDTLHNLILTKMEETKTLNSKSKYSVEFIVDYNRIYNIGGKALNKPRISYTEKIYQDGILIRTYESGKFTTKYSYLKDTAVALEIAAFRWGKEDEPKDLEALANIVTSELKKTGD